MSIHASAGTWCKVGRMNRQGARDTELRTTVKWHENIELGMLTASSGASLELQRMGKIERAGESTQADY